MLVKFLLSTYKLNLWGSYWHEPGNAPADELIEIISHIVVGIDLKFLSAGVLCWDKSTT